jgi:ABC-2 type transport system ATP-binding protein
VPVIRVHDLRKRYGDVVALDGVSFAVEAGTTFGLLGPNGAGKTTALEIVCGLRVPDGGRLDVLGESDPRRYRDRIGVQLQATALFHRLTVLEHLELFAGFYPKPRPVAEMLEIAAISEVADRYAGRLSGGQRQRLAIALALVGGPDVCLLDEPSAGLDPQARLHLRGTIDAIKARGTTVVMTTHYLEEAERLCDQVAIVDRGRVLAQGAPRDLVRELRAGHAIEFCAPNGKLRPAELRALPAATGGEAVGGEHVLYSSDPPATLDALFELARARDVRLDDLRVRAATLEDLYIEKTGRFLRE